MHVKMKMAEYYINILQQHSEVLRTKYGITTMRLFGSVARGEQDANSDVDLFVEMPPRLLQIAGAHQYLESLLGCNVDMVRNHSHIDTMLLKQIERDGIQVIQ